MDFDDLTGKKFGRLTVIERAPSKYCGAKKIKPVTMWKCVCECGKETVVSRSSLIGGTTVSCGCKVRKHGYANKERLYETWKNMRRRCEDPFNKRFEQYGGKGIRVCKEWDDYLVFREWAMNNGYNDDLTIDRIDVDGDYCPENCRWATKIQQMNNTTRNHYIEYHGEVRTVAEWSRHFGMPYVAFNSRVCHGWSIDRILSTPYHGVYYGNHIEAVPE